VGKRIRCRSRDGRGIQDRPAAAAPQLVEGRVRGDAVRPSGKSAPSVKSGDASRYSGHCLLCRVERVLLVSEQAAADRVAAVVMTPEKRLECSSIPLLGGRDNAPMDIGGTLAVRR